MTRRNFSRLKRRKQMRVHGVENIHDLPPVFAPIARRQPRLVTPSKAALRTQADKAFEEWLARRGDSK